jgi:hypothetical protein
MASSAVSVRMVELARVRSLVLRVALLTTLSVGAVLSVLDAGLHSAHAPLGIVSFELAGADAAAILADWSDAQRRDALLLQGLDYLFIPGYATLLAVMALSQAARLGQRAPRLRKLAPLAAGAAALAGAADVVENVPMILMLRAGAANPTGAAIAEVCATIKFALVLAVILYAIGALVSRVGRTR